MTRAFGSCLAIGMARVPHPEPSSTIRSPGYKADTMSSKSSLTLPDVGDGEIPFSNV